VKRAATLKCTQTIATARWGDRRRLGTPGGEKTEDQSTEETTTNQKRADAFQIAVDTARARKVKTNGDGGGGRAAEVSLIFVRIARNLGADRTTESSVGGAQSVRL